MKGLIEGRIVHYVLREQDAQQITRRRLNGALPEGWPTGAQAHTGNPVVAGEHVPAIIVKVWPHEFGDEPGVNLQCLLDGNDSFWVTSTRFDDSKAEGTCHWIEKD